MQLKVKEIEAELSQLRKHFIKLEKRLKEIQRYCDHQFVGDTYYQKCKKCNKVDVLYY